MILDFVFILKNKLSIVVEKKQLYNCISVIELKTFKNFKHHFRYVSIPYVRETLLVRGNSLAKL